MRKRFHVLMLLVILGLAQSAQAALLTPALDSSTQSGYALKVSSWWDQGPAYLFNETGINYGDATYDNSYSDATGDVSPIIWMDFGSEKTFSALGYANRTTTMVTGLLA